MPFQIGCPKCQHKYTLAEEFRGKAIRCQKCSHAFRIPGPQAVGTASAGKQKQVGGQPDPAMATVISDRRAKAAQPARSTNPGAAINAPLRSENDVFDGAGANNQIDPLSNHVVQNPGFAFVDPAKYAPVQETGPDVNSLHYNPAIAELVAKVDHAKQEHTRLTQQTWWPVFVALGAIGLTVIPGIIMMLVMPTLGVLFLILACVVVGIVASVAEIWTLVLIYKYEPDQFTICFLFAPLRYGFLSRNWERHKDVGSLLLISIIGVLGLMIMFFAMGFLAG